MSETIHEISVDKVVASAKQNVERYSVFVKHAPKLLRQSMMLAYQTAVDDMLKAMDNSRTKGALTHDSKPAIILDENGHPA